MTNNNDHDDELFLACEAERAARRQTIADSIKKGELLKGLPAHYQDAYNKTARRELERLAATAGVHEVRIEAIPPAAAAVIHPPKRSEMGSAPAGWNRYGAAVPENALQLMKQGEWCFPLDRACDSSCVTCPHVLATQSAVKPNILPVSDRLAAAEHAGLRRDLRRRVSPARVLAAVVLLLWGLAVWGSIAYLAVK